MSSGWIRGGRDGEISCEGLVDESWGVIARWRA